MIEKKLSEPNVEEIFSRLRNEFQKTEADRSEAGRLDWYPEDDILLEDEKLNELHALHEILKSLLKDRDPRIGASLFSTRPYVGKVIVLVKRVVRRILRPYSSMILSRQADFNASLLRLLDAMMEKWLQNRAAIESLDQQLVQLRDAHNEHTPRIDALYYERLVLKRNMERLLEGGIRPAASDAPLAVDAFAREQTLDDGSYYLFEGFHRGDSKSIAEKQTEYCAFFEGKDEVLDVGCGRGEFLALLRDRGIKASGVDSNQVMVEECKQNGFTVVCADLIEHLKGVEDGRYGGIFSSQVVEHLSASVIARFISLAAQKIRPGGVIVVETLNPLSLAGFAEYFYKDPTHVTPVHPETLSFLLKSSGFKNVRTEFRSPTEKEKMLKKIPAAGTRGDNDDYTILNENIEKLNRVLFGFQEYAVIAEK